MAKPAQRDRPGAGKEQKIRERFLAQMKRWGMRLGVPVLSLAQARGEDQVSYRHESYQEDNNRVRVETETALIKAVLAPWLDIKVTSVYDAISGATPSGAPAPNSFTLHPTGTTLSIPGTAITTFKKSTSLDAVSGASSSSSSRNVSTTAVPTGIMMDKRTAVDLSAGMTFGPHRIIPQFSYSEEIDYISYAGALNYELELNQKNTVLKAGWSHAADRIIPNANTFLQQQEFKNSDDFLVGVTQLLGPKTVLNANFTFGHAEGYFDDPYRGVIFDGTMPSGTRMDTLTIYPEHRPAVRSKQVADISLTQAVTPLDGSVEASYRFYHDSYEIYGHTAGLAWFQKVGSFLVVSPSFRYYMQSAASFYGTIFSGDPVTDPSAVPEFYSSDYRLSKMETFSLGIQATVKARDWLGFDLGYQHYIMRGLDGVTSQSAYPNANVFTIGATLWF
jgi:hypothetical protein